MPTPTRQKSIGIKVPDASIGEYVKVTNLTSGGQYYGRLQGTDRSVIISQNEDFVWNEGDSIQITMLGRLKGVSNQVVTGGGVNVTLSASADTSTPAVDL